MESLKTLHTRKFFIVALLFYWYVLPANGSYQHHPKAQAFIDQMVERHGMQRDELNALFAMIEPQTEVIEAISRPAERVLQWKDYRPIFITDKRINEGVAFWQKHQTLLEEVEKAYQVPTEIIVAIIGVETYFGNYMGKYSVFACLATLAFDYPRRAKFFRSELEHYLLLTQQEGLDPLSIKGSYAAAMGMPQFISSSYREYAVDFDGDGQRNLWVSMPDILASVANYFKRHGWQPGQPVVEVVAPAGSTYKSLVTDKLRPNLDNRALMSAGIEPQQSSPGKKALYQVEDANGQQLWLGYNNFYVITRYNHSKLYAMAVYQLSQAIAAKMAQ